MTKSHEHKWHYRFLDIAARVASWSKDPSTKCGAVIVNKNKIIVSTGYNGLARGVEDYPEILNNRELKLQLTIHSEENAIINANRESLVGGVIYCYPYPPCSTCAAKIIQAEISGCVFPLCNIPERWCKNMDLSVSMMLDAKMAILKLPMDEAQRP